MVTWRFLRWRSIFIQASFAGRRIWKGSAFWCQLQIAFQIPWFLADRIGTRRTQRGTQEPWWAANLFFWNGKVLNLWFVLGSGFRSNCRSATAVPPASCDRHKHFGLFPSFLIYVVSLPCVFWQNVSYRNPANTFASASLLQSLKSAQPPTNCTESNYCNSWR